MREHRSFTPSPFVAAIALAAAVSGCAGAPLRSTSRGTPAPGGEQENRLTLLRVARQFNADYAANKDGLVYGRWDPASRRIISRAEYVRRHRECPTAPGPAVVERAIRRRGGYWAVTYEISGTQLVDYWRYTHGRWWFDLPRSNPSAVALYRMPFSKYAAAVGCDRPS